LGQAILVALLQPSPEVVMLFDDIVVLGDGNVVYHGPLENCLPYFKRLGFRCPENKDIGDFLQELPTPSGQAYVMAEDELAKVKGGIDAASIPRAPDEFALRWKGSKEGKEAARMVHIEEQCQIEKSKDLELRFRNSPIKSYDDFPRTSFVKEIYYVTSWVLMCKLKDKSQTYSKIFNSIFLGFLYGSLFWQVKPSEWYVKAMLFQTVPNTMQQSALTDMQDLIMDRKIFYKHNAASFYKGTTYSLAIFLVNLPYSVFDALVFGQFVYWMCGLDPHLEQWSWYMLIAVLHALTMNQMMRIFAFTGSDRDAAMVGAVLTILVFGTFNGSLATPDCIPGYLMWIFWINPLAWSIRALAINEFSSKQYDTQPCPLTEEDTNCSSPTAICSPDRCGDFYLKARAFETDPFYLSGCVAVLCIYIVLSLAFTSYVMTYTRFGNLYSAPVGDENEDELESTVVDIQTIRTESLALQTKTLVFSDLWYTVQIPATETEESKDIDLLKGICGFAEPGKMTALMVSFKMFQFICFFLSSARGQVAAARLHYLMCLEEEPIEEK